MYLVWLEMELSASLSWVDILYLYTTSTGVQVVVGVRNVKDSIEDSSKE